MQEQPFLHLRLYFKGSSKNSDPNNTLVLICDRSFSHFVFVTNKNPKLCQAEMFNIFQIIIVAFIINK